MTYLLHEQFINPKIITSSNFKILNRNFSAAFESVTWFTYRDNIDVPLIGSKL